MKDVSMTPGDSEINPIQDPAIADEEKPKPKMTPQDKDAYIGIVRYVFISQPSAYNLFLDILKAYETGAMDTVEVMVRIAKLFQGHERLILGFNSFLPPGYQLKIGTDGTPSTTIPEFGGLGTSSAAIPTPPIQNTVAPVVQPADPEILPAKTEVALVYLKTVRQAFTSNPEAFSLFSEILTAYGGRIINIKECIQRVCLLFQSQVQLVPDFNHHLPSGYHIRVIKDTNLVDYITGYDTPGGFTPLSLKPNGIATNAAAAPSTPYTRELEKAGWPKDGEGETYIEKVKLALALQPDDKFKQFLAVMKAFNYRDISIIEAMFRMSQLLEGHDDLILAFSYFLPPRYKIQIDAAERKVRFSVGFRGPKGYSVLKATHMDWVAGLGEQDDHRDDISDTKK